MRLDVTGPYNRALVATLSKEAAFTVEAPPPERRAAVGGRLPRPRWCRCLRSAQRVLGAADLDVTAPHRALAGSVLSVPYQVSGVGSVSTICKRETVCTTGRRSDSQSGVLKLQIPHDGTGSPYTLHVRMRNLFMKDERASTIASVSGENAEARANAGPVLRSTSYPSRRRPCKPELPFPCAIRQVRRAVTCGWWTAPALRGRTAIFRRRGSRSSPFRQQSAGKDLRVVVHAQRGQRHAESSVGLTAPSVPHGSANSNEPAASASPQATAAPAIAPELRLSAQVVSAGDSVTAEISGVRGDVRITMMSATGMTVAEGDVGQGGALSLNAPNVHVPHDVLRRGDADERRGAAKHHETARLTPR